MDNILADFAQIKTLIFDVDGVMTNGTVQVTEQGDLLRTMNIKDGYALKLAANLGYKIAIITGGASEGVRLRFAKLGITDYFSNVHDKILTFDAYHQRHGLRPEQTLYMGDDMPDIPCMRAAKIACAPSDAVAEVLATANYICKSAGGQGAVREVVELVLRQQQAWHQA